MWTSVAQFSVPSLRTQRGSASPTLLRRSRLGQFLNTGWHVPYASEQGEIRKGSVAIRDEATQSFWYDVGSGGK